MRTSVRTRTLKRVRFETADPEADQKERVLDEMHNRYSDGSNPPSRLNSLTSRRRERWFDGRDLIMEHRYGADRSTLRC
jgi:hypothetical protein